MTRFYSEYEIKMQDKKLNEDLLQNNDKFKEDLKDALNKDNHRSNVDRAKKKAVSQLMDYDNFHQMVLGADLKGMKMSDVVDIKPEKAIINPISEYKNISNKKSDMFYRSFVPENESKDIKFYTDEQLTLPKFKIKWKNFDNANDKVNFLFDNITSIERFKQLVDKRSIDVDIFIEFIYNFAIFLNESNEKNDKVIYIIKCLDILTNCAYFKKMKMFIAKKHKEIYTQLQLKEYIKTIPEINAIINIILSK